MEQISDIIYSIDELLQDTRIPRNIRDRLRVVKEILSDEKTDIAIRIHKAITELDSITEEPNIPMYTRTQIWFLMTLLESLQS